MSEMFFRERVKSVPTKEAIELVYGPKLRDGLKNYDHMLQIHRAHAVMLVRQGVIAPEVGAALLMAVCDLQQQGPEAIEIDPQLGDLFYNIEKALISRLGARVAGQLHTGRSRNDLHATMHRMRTRESALQSYTQVIDLREALLNLAAQHTESVMPGYTHLKPAQPITFGYYLTGVATALERDTRRIVQAYNSTNLNPLGAAALAGTSYPIDRELTTRLLGFDGMVENCIDAVASRDYAIELVAALALLTTTISRVATDLYIWQTDEFGLIELSDGISGTSSIMPQKKNPGVLERTRGRSAQLHGALMACLSGTKSTIFSDEGESAGAGVQQMDMAVAESASAMRLLGMAVRNMQVNRDAMASRAASDYCTVTDLADAIVRRAGISFHEAHAIVGRTVNRAVAARLPATAMTLDMLNVEARQVLGRDLNMSDREVEAALDPMASVEGKITIGGTAPAEVRRAIGAALQRILSDRADLAGKLDRLAAADAELEQMTRALTD